MERITSFDPTEIKNLARPEGNSKNGQVTIIGGSELFHGAPLLSLKVTSKIVDMVFFSSPDPSIGEAAAELKSKLYSFIWVPWEDIGSYIKRSDAVLIGPGLMRYRRGDTPVMDEAWKMTREITQKLLEEYKDKRWVIDAGSLQVLEKSWIPKGAILTPNKKEYAGLFGDMEPSVASAKFNCTILFKDIVDTACTEGKCVAISGGNAGMSKGGSGDALAGLVTALLAKNEAQISAAAASYIAKKSGDELFSQFGPYYNSDQLADKIPEVLNKLQK